MASGFQIVITQLEQEKAVIERALAALHGLNGIAAPAPASQVSARRSARAAWPGREATTHCGLEEAVGCEEEGGKEGCGRLASTAKAPAKRKGGMTPEGRKRLAEAMRRRWAAKRAASAVKKTERKQTKKAA